MAIVKVIVVAIVSNFFEGEERIAVMAVSERLINRRCPVSEQIPILSTGTECADPGSLPVQTNAVGRACIVVLVFKTPKLHCSYSCNYWIDLAFGQSLKHQTRPHHSIYLYSGFRSPFSIFSYSVKLISGPAFSRFLFWLQQARKYKQQLAALRQMNPKQTLYPKWKKFFASVAGKIYVAIIPPILPAPICHAVPIARR